MRVSRKGVAFIAGWEGFRSCPYRDPVGVWTRGYGETEGIAQGSRCVTEGEARESLAKRLRQDYLSHVPRRRRMRRHERDALASFAYNNGVGAVTDSSFSTLAKRLEGPEGRGYGTRKQVYREELPKWVRAAGQTLPGLVRRRKAEVDLACNADYSGQPKAP